MAFTQAPPRFYVGNQQLGGRKQHYVGQACKHIPRYSLSEMLCEVTKMHPRQTLGQLTAQLWKQKRQPHAWNQRAPKGNSRLSGELVVL